MSPTVGKSMPWRNLQTRYQPSGTAVTPVSIFVSTRAHMQFNTETPVTGVTPPTIGPRLTTLWTFMVVAGGQDRRVVACPGRLPARDALCTRAECDGTALRVQRARFGHRPSRRRCAASGYVPVPLRAQQAGHGESR